jgi:Ca2+ transporting ATPase
LSVAQWIFCTAIGLFELIWQQVICCVPNSAIFFKKKTEPAPPNVDEECTIEPEPTVAESEVNRGQILWFRGLNRIQQQIRVINAFRSSLYEGGRQYHHTQLGTYAHTNAWENRVHNLNNSNNYKNSNSNNSNNVGLRHNHEEQEKHDDRIESIQKTENEIKNNDDDVAPENEITPLVLRNSTTQL